MKLPRRLARLGLPFLLALNHGPVTLFSLLLVTGSVVVLARADLHLDHLVRDLGRGQLRPEDIDAFAAWTHGAWLVLMVTLVPFAVFGIWSAVFAYRTLARRIGAIVSFAEQLAAGKAQGELEVVADDALGRLEASLGRVAREIDARDASLREEARRQQLEATVQRALAMAESEEEAAKATARALNEMVPNGIAELLLADASQASLERVAANDCGCGCDGLGCPTESPARCPAVAQGHPLVFRSASQLDACPKLAARLQPAGGAACIPVNMLGKSVGVLHAAAKPGAELSDAQVRGLESVATHFGHRVGTMRMLATTQLQAETDALTGLLNRRSLFSKAGAHFGTGEPVAVALLDLDHFKRLNDTFGHDAGDRAIRTFAQVLRASVRPGDLVARFGGEEFVVVLGECNSAHATQVLERVRETLAEAVERAGIPPVTVSVGVALAPEHGTTLEDLLHAADVALYAAKRDGRDRVHLAGTKSISRSAAG